MSRLFEEKQISKYYQWFLINLACSVVYFLFARLGLQLASVVESASPVWPASGLAIAIIYHFGYRAVPSLYIGACLANSMTGAPIESAFVIALGNTLEGIIGFEILLKFLASERKYFYNLRTIAFITAAIFAPVVSASIGVFSLKYWSVIPGDLAGEVFLTWWTGDALGAFVLAPVLILAKKFIRDKSDSLFCIAVLGVSFVLGYLVYFTENGGAFAFVLLPCLLMAAKYVDPYFSLVVSLVIFSLGVFATASGFGPFTGGDINSNLMNLQLFSAALAVTGLALSSYRKERYTKLPIVVLLVCWFMTGTLFFSFETSEKSKTETRFNILAREAENLIVDSMKAYEDALGAGVGLYSASEQVDYKEWLAYFQSLKVLEKYPGINGLGVIVAVSPVDLEKFERNNRSDQQKNFQVKAAPFKDLSYATKEKPHFVIKFIEPIGSNLQALGLDIGSEEVRRTGAELARDTGEVSVSKKIILVQDRKQSPGFLMYLPIYKNGSALNSVTDRRKNLFGWVYGPFIAEKFFNTVLKKASDQIELEVYEGKVFSPENLLFSNRSNSELDSNYTKESNIIFGQNNLSFVWRDGSKFRKSHSSIIAWVGLFGALASLFLLNLMLGLELLGEKSQALAKELTKELKNSQEKFKEGERRLLYALEGSEDGIWDWDLNNSEMYVFGKIAEILAWPSLTKVRSIKDIKDYVHNNDIQPIEDSMKSLLRNESNVHEVETRYKKPGGSWVWVLTRGKVSERDKNGRPTRVTGVHINIQEFKEAQESVENTQKQLRSVANNIPALVSLWSLSFQCKFANFAFSNWFGFDGQMPQDLEFENIIDANIVRDQDALFDDMYRGKHLEYERKVLRHLDGKERYVVVTLVPTEIESNIKGFFLFVQDITELKMAELQAQEDRKTALEAAKIKTQFLANMSHEIRTPINGIIGMTNLLRNTKLNHEQKDFAETISRSSDNLLTIINDILDFSKIEAGKLQLEEIDFNLYKLVEDIHKTFSFAAKDRKIELHLDRKLKKNQYYKGDPSRIVQVFNNLLGNAIKFTPEGSVTLSAKMETEEGDNTVFLFEVIDTGIGIAKKSIHKMFDAFSQADSTTSRKFGGTGLGLSISKQLVELMGGQIGLTSEEGKGSVFWFRLVLVDGRKPASLKTEKSKSISSRNSKILLVEDNSVNQIIATSILKDLGYHPHSAGDGKEALLALEEFDFDLILMDCQMPVLDGYETTKIIRKEESSFASIPILAMTASADEGEREKCIESGMDDYILKPVDAEELFVKIEKHLKLRNTKKIKKKTFPLEKKRGSVLAVEDNLVNQRVIQLSLESLGYRCTIAENGEVALNLLNGSDFDLILMDCQMPIMDGYEATRHIRNLPGDKGRIPIIALTANAIEGDRQLCLQAGMNDYLSKPIDLKLLESTIEHFLSTKSLEDNSALGKTQSIEMKVFNNLLKLETEESPGFVSSIIDMYFEMANEETQKLRLAIEQANYREISNIAHSLKSTSANLGAMGLSKILADMESFAGKNSPILSIHDSFIKMEQEILSVIAGLEQIKASMGSDK